MSTTALVSVVTSFTVAEDPCAESPGYDVTAVFVGENGGGGGGSDIEFFGTWEGINGFAIGTTSCNRGNVVAPWYGGTNNTPVISQSCYRIADGRFEQIGLAWLKHSSCAVSEPGCETWTGGGCQGTDCSTLGIGCADTYWAGFNASAGAPRSEINATTGAYDYPFSIGPTGPSGIRGKIQLLESDLVLPDAEIYMEASYVEPGEHLQCDGRRHLNNASHCKTIVHSPTSIVRDQDWGPTSHMEPAIMAWATHGATVIQLDTVESGGIPARVNVGWLVTDNGDGTWHYEYVVHNQNSHRCIRQLSIPLMPGTTLTNVGFHDIHYNCGEEDVIHGTDWTFEQSFASATWSALDEGSATNAIRWATSYTFRFDADAPPTMSNIHMTYWRSGPGGSLAFTGQAPGTAGCPGDFTGDGVVNVSDVLSVLAAFGNGADVEDLLTVLAHYGLDC
ncbi:MAG: hypothetical protein MK101_05140 [Phycisphaerales bacterium]|nr:hypothetical protein [Phycisphaerales bacterium]